MTSSCLISEVEDLKLVFAPSAWIKLQYLCHKADTEIGGFGIALDRTKPLYVNDLLIPKQECTTGYCDLDMEDVAALSEPLWQELEDGRVYNPASTAIWIHTHPRGIDGRPSGVDESTFKARGGDWALMFILSQNGTMSCRLRVNTPLGKHQQEIPIYVDWASFPDAWQGGVISTWDDELKKVSKKAEYKTSSGYIINGNPYPGAWHDRDFCHNKSTHKRGRGRATIPEEYEKAWAEYLEENESARSNLTGDEVFEKVERALRGS